MKKLQLFVALLFAFLVRAQQQLPLSVISQIGIAGADSFVGVDPYGFAYLLSNNALIKSKGLRDASFQEPSLGKISRVDLTNPLQIVVFYENFNTVVLLDSQLNEIRRFDFNKLQEKDIQLSVHAAGLASQNRLWIYDSLTQKIGLFDFARQEVQFVTVPLPRPVKYQTEYNTFIWQDAGGNAFSSDVFGKVSTLGKIPESAQVQYLQNGKMLLLENGKITIFDPVTTTSTAIDIAEKTFAGFYYNDQILSIFTKHGITNYKITIP